MTSSNPARSPIPSHALAALAISAGLATGVALGGCAAQPTAEKAPWISSPQSAVNPSSTLAAVGQGGDPEAARAAAVRAVTREVADRVGAPGFNVDQYAERLLRAGEDPRSTTELLTPREFVVAAPAVNIQVIQQAQDPRTGRFATLATIDRASLSQVYASEAARNADIVARLWNGASGQNSYQFTETLISAQLAAQARDALARGAQKIGESLPTPPGVTAFRPTQQEIRAAMAQATSPVSAGVFAESDLPPAIADEVRQELFRLRVPQFTDRSQADIDILTRFTTEPTNQSATGAMLLTWRLTLEPVTKTGTSLEMLLLEGKTGSRTLEEARQEAQRLAVAELRQKGEDFLRRVLYSQGNAPVLPPVVTTTITNTTTTTTTTTSVQSPTVTTTTVTPAPPATTTTTTTTTPGAAPANPR
jgi:hypothetical protein